MNDLNQRLEAGSLLIIETGEYSSRDFDEPVRLAAATTRGRLLRSFTRYWAGRKRRPEDISHPTSTEFLAWLVKTGRAEPAAADRWHFEYAYECHQEELRKIRRKG